MARVHDPLSEMPVYLVGDCYSVWRSWFSALGGDKTNFDPIVDDPVTDAVLVADLPNTKRAVGRGRSRDLVFVA